MAESKHIAKPSDLPQPKKRTGWFWLLWALGGVIILILLAALIMWSKRYTLIENMAIDALAQDGIEAELKIENLTQTQAVLRDVRLKYNGQVFFEAQRIDAVYEWRDALEGQIISAAFSKPRAYITLNETGAIIDDWLPPANSANTELEGGPQNLFPKEGISLKDGKYFIQSPYGAAAINGDITVNTPQNFTAALTLEPTHLTYNEFALSGGGALNLDTMGAAPKLEGQFTLSSLSHPAIDVKALSLTINGTPDIEVKTFDGHAKISFDALESAQAFIGQSEIIWDGNFASALDANAQTTLDLSGAWQAKMMQARIPDPVRSDALADTLSFSGPLSKSPIAQNFVPEIREVLNSLLTGSDITARGTLERNANKFDLHLTAPAQVKSFQSQLTLTPRTENPVYSFDRRAQRITAILDAKFTQPAGLNLTNVVLNARSVNGVRLDGVEDFNAQIETRDAWETYGIDSRRARLSPFAINMHYTARDIAKRRVNFSGAVDYDGVLPGGYVTGLKIAGDMGLNFLQDGRLILGYTPKASTRLRIDKFETTTDWTVYDLDADIASTAALFELSGPQGDSTADVALSDIRVNIQRKTDAAKLNMRADSLAATGTLAREDGAANALVQNWDMQFTQTLVTSDDLPGPDTIITLAEGQLKAKLITGEEPNFDLTTPSANIQTQLVNVDNMRLRLHGTPDNYDIEHNGGRVKLEGNRLPLLPVEGRLNVADGTFIGNADARLPQADNTPIAMSYNIRDGAGYADVNIEALQFTPNGLQPQSLISALRGKIAQVDGLVSAKIRLEFARGLPLRSSGTAKIVNMSLGTAPGPLTGMNMELTMDSVLPLISRGKQRITMAEFDPGIPLEDGVIDFELVDGGVKIYDAKWPVGDGFFSLDPFVWKYDTEENRLVMRLSNVQLGKFIENMGNGSVNATGQLQGEFPIVISGVNVRVDKGHVFVKNGGIIRYNPDNNNAAPPVTYTQEEAIKILRTKDQSRYSSLARDALREFKYDELSVKVDGALDGEVELGTVFSGSNPKVLNGQPFEFDINVVGELFNIIRSFDSNAQIKSQLEKQGIATDVLVIGDETPN